MTAHHPLRILITALPPSRLPGAVPTAPVGRLLAQDLLSAGHEVRVVAPASEATGWPPAVDLVEGSVIDPELIADAFRGVDRVFLAGLVSFEHVKMRELTNLLLDGPLTRVVVLSSHGSDFESQYSPETWQWLAFERALQLRDASWIYLRPAGLFANLFTGGYPISGADYLTNIETGEPIREFLPDVEYPYMDEADLATIAAHLLLDEATRGHPIPGQVDVIGCLSSARQRIRSLNRQVGLDLTLEALPDEHEARFFWQQRGWPDVTIEVTLYAMQALAHPTPEARQAIRGQIVTAQSILGRPPRTFDDWLRAHSSQLRASSPVHRDSGEGRNPWAGPVNQR